MERTVERGDSSSFFFFNEGENGRERRAGTHDQPQTKKERKKENDNDWFTSKQRQQYQQQQRKNGEGIRLMQRADLVACSCGGGNALRREQCCVRVCAFSFFCVCFPPLVLGRRCACSHFFFFSENLSFWGCDRAGWRGEMPDTREGREKTRTRTRTRTKRKRRIEGTCVGRDAHGM
jgi:hypothetical protein